MTPTLAQLADLPSWLASDLTAYLKVLCRRLLEQPLLQKIAGGEVGEFWLPLRCTRDPKLFARTRYAGASTASPAAGVADEAAFLRQTDAVDNLGGAESSQPVHRFISAEVFLEERTTHVESTATVILGDPGSGKTELLRRRARQEASAQLESLRAHRCLPEDLCPPLFVAFKSLVGLLSPDTLQQAVLEEISAAVDRHPLARSGVSAELRQCLASLLAAAEAWPRESGQMLTHLLDQWLQPDGATQGGRPFLLCLDGWDEVRGADREKVARLLGPLFRALSKRERRGLDRLQIIVSSRLYGFDYHLLPFGRCGYLVPFQQADIIQYIREFFRKMPGSRAGAAAELEKQLRLHPSVNESCTNPMVLTLLCSRFHQSPSIPDTRAAIYYEALKGLAGRDARIHKGASIEGADARADEKLRALAKAAAKAFPAPALTAMQLQDCFRNETLFLEVMRDDLVLRTTGQRDGEVEFLHLTFQEYLTATWLVEQEDLPARLIDAAMTPAWSQVVRMTLGLASVARPGKFALGTPAWGFGALARALASPTSQPWPGFGSLLLASAASDLGPLEEDARVLLEILFSDWVTARSGEDSGILPAPLEAAFQKLHRGLNGTAVEEFFCQKLDAAESAPLAAGLLTRAGIALTGARSIKKLCAAVERDQPGAGWPIHGYLAVQIATPPVELFEAAPAAVGGESEKLRAWIEQHQIESQEIESDTRWGTPQHGYLVSTLTGRIRLRQLLLRSAEADACVAHINDDPMLQVLAGIFFGGLNNLRLVECLEQFIDAQRRFSASEHLARPGQKHQAACELDVGIIPWRDAIRKKGVTFDARRIFIESALDEPLTGWIRQRLPAAEILARLLSLAAEATTPPRRRAEAALAVHCLGDESAAAALAELPEDVRAEAGRRASLLRAMMVDAVLRAAPVAAETMCNRPEDDDANTAPPEAQVRELHLIHRVNRLYGGLSMGATGTMPPRFAALQYSELIARALSGFEDGNPEYPEDVVYNLAVVLDTIGRKLSASNCLVDWMRALPFTENSRSEVAPVWLGWESRDPALAGVAYQKPADASPTALRRNLGLCIDAVCQGATPAMFFKGWALACLLPVLRETCPGLATEAVFYATRYLPDDCYESRGMVLRAAGQPDGVDTAQALAAARENLDEWPAVAARLLIRLAACRAADEEALVREALEALARVEDTGERADLLEALARVCRRTDTFRAVLAALAPLDTLPAPDPAAVPAAEMRCMGKSFAEGLVRGAWRLDNYLRGCGLDTGLDALWRRSLENPGDAGLRRRLREAAVTQGFTLTRTRIRTLEAALERHGAAAVGSFLRIPRRASKCAGTTLRRWLHDVPDAPFRNACAVLLLEQGVLNPAVAAQLPEIATSPDDALWQRMQQALAPASEYHIGWQLSAIGLKTALLVEAAAERFRGSQPGLAGQFAKFAGVLWCDDADAFADLCTRAATDLRSPACRLLTSLRRLDVDSFARSVTILSSGPAELRLPLLQVWACLLPIPATSERGEALLNAAEDVLDEFVRTGPLDLAAETLRAYQNLGSRFNGLPADRAASGLRRMLRAGVQRCRDAFGKTVSAHYLHALGRLLLTLPGADTAALASCLTPGAPPSAGEDGEGLFTLMREMLSDPALPAARVAAVSLLVEAKQEEIAVRAADSLDTETIIGVFSVLLDTYLYEQTRESHTTFGARLLLRRTEWLRGTMRRVIELLGQPLNDAFFFGADGDATFMRSNLLTLAGRCVQLGGDLERIFADNPDTTGQIVAAVGECLSQLGFSRGRRAALQILHFLPGGAGIILDHLADLVRDLPTVTGAILGSSEWRFPANQAGELLGQFEDRIEEGSALELAYSIVLLGNCLLAGEGGVTAAQWKRLLAAIDQLPDTEFHGVQSGNLSPAVIFSTPLRRWVNERLCQMLHLVEATPWRALVPYIVFDAPVRAIFVDSPASCHVRLSTVQLLISERPQKGKRAAEYQLRYFGETFFGSRTTNTDPWFKTVSEQAEKDAHSLRNLFGATQAEPGEIRT